MYFTLAKNSKIWAIASTADVIYCTVVYEQGMNPSSDFLDTDKTIFATAYIDAIQVHSIALKNTSASTVTGICIYVDENLLLPCFSLLAGQSILIDSNGQSFQQVSPSTNVNVTCTGGGGGGTSITWQTLSDADFVSGVFIAEDNKGYNIPLGVLTSDKTIDMSAVATINEYCYQDETYKISFSPISVYYFGGAEIADQLLGRNCTRIQMIDSKLVITE